MVRRVVLTALAIEVIGTIFIFVTAPNDVGLFDAVFHAVSAFNNAGFSTWTGGLAGEATRGAGRLQVVMATLIVFEEVSAFATVGLSTGVTEQLTTPGKAVVMATMFIGRLGPLALACSLVSSPSAAHDECPAFMIG